jgi:hypothetical protein
MLGLRLIVKKGLDAYIATDMPHKDNVDSHIDEAVEKAATAIEADCKKRLEAMPKGDFNIQSDFEKRITEKVNETNVGPP